ncbi:unnamed protein product [Lymnaea stagnalis]|uniref:Peptidase M12B domain-containing protein n=1 Tax=Lymnaea stagnalis TaxID=6523 RepID=A0AAV2IB95_LYMST
MKTIFALLGVALLHFTQCQAQTHELELYVVADSALVLNQVKLDTSSDTYNVKYQRAQQNVRADINYVLNQADSMLAGLTGVTVGIKLRKLDILTTNVITLFLPGTNYVVDSAVAKVQFQNWLSQQNSYALLGYDLAILYTGFDLYGSGGLLETSNTNFASVCDRIRSLAIIEFQPTYRDVYATAHSIGFVLGANNDGAASSNVMASLNTPTDINRWSYSTCSATSIKDYLRLLPVNCLLSSSSQSTKPSFSVTSYTGNILKPDVICQRALNDTRTYMCKSLPATYNNLPPRGNAVCSQIYCRVPNTMTCTSVFTSDGMVCDRSKRCSKGQCVVDRTTETQNVNPNCVWGDQKTLEFPTLNFYGTCPTFISAYKAFNCYSSPINESCCATCKSYNTGRVGCEYGDKSVDCVKYTKASVCPTYGSNLCCGYCAGYVGKRSTNEGSFPVPALNATQPDKNVAEITETIPYADGHHIPQRR